MGRQIPLAGPLVPPTPFVDIGGKRDTYIYIHKGRHPIVLRRRIATNGTTRYGNPNSFLSFFSLRGAHTHLELRGAPMSKPAVLAAADATTPTETERSLREKHLLQPKQRSQREEHLIRPVEGPTLTRRHRVSAFTISCVIQQRYIAVLSGRCSYVYYCINALEVYIFHCMSIGQNIVLWVSI